MITKQEDVRCAVRNAFKAIRRKGVFARMNFLCCQNCAWAEISDLYPDDDHPCLFFHAQDNDDLYDGSVFLAHSGDAALIAVPILEKHGLKVDWDGDQNKRIFVTFHNQGNN